jgi:hypothetical protein
MEYFCYSLAIVAVLYASGLGFTLLILPESLRRYTLILAPWIGFCYVGLACWPVFYYGGQIGPKTARAVLIAPILCLVIELIRKRRADLGRTILYVPTLGALAVAAASFVTLSIPVFWNSGRLTTVSLGNNDIPTYAAVARYLSEFTRHSMGGFVGQMAVGPNPFERVTKDYYFGSPALIAFEGKLLGLMPHQHTSLCVFLIFALGAAVVLLLLHDTFQLRVTPALFGVAFVAFHPMIQFIALEGFFAQVTGAGLALLIFWTNTKLFNRNSARFDKLRLWILLTLFTCGLLLNYSHMLLFVWFLVALYTIILAFLERSLHGIKICAATNILAVLATALILPQRIGPFLDVFKTYAAAEAGWFIVWMAPVYVAGLMYENPPFLEAVSGWRIDLALSLVATLVFALAMFFAYRRGFRKIVAFGLACLAVYAGCFVLAIMGRTSGLLGGYKSFKLVSFFLPFFGAALVSLVAVLKSGHRRTDLAVKSIVVAALIPSYIMADKMMLRPARYLRVEPDYEVLRGLERTESVKSINVLTDVFWPTMWTAYFLMHKKIYLERQSYYKTSELIGDYNLEDKACLRSQILHVMPAQTPAVARLNDRFSLTGPLKRKVRAKLGLGWYLGEIGHLWSGKDGKRSSVIIHSDDDGVKVSLKLIYAPLRPDDRLTLQSNGTDLSPDIHAKPDGREEMNISELVLNMGDNEVDIVSELDPVRPNAADPRLVSYSFSLVEVDEL